LFDSFPMASTTIKEPPTDDPSLEFLRDLVAQDKMDDAVFFCAYLLGRREAVWWACQSVRRLFGMVPDTDMPALKAAEAWVHDPSPERKRMAEEIAAKSNPDSATTWLANAAVWSGGAITMGRAAPIAPPPEMTPHAAAVAIQLAAGPLREPGERSGKLKICIEDGARLAQTGLS
jgi:hypothetical protein